MAGHPDKSELRIHLFGAPLIQHGGQAVTFDTSRAVALLAYLTVCPGRHSRERVSGLIWPDYTQDRAFANLRRTLWSVRRTLGEGCVVSSTEFVELDGDVWTDVGEFHSSLKRIASYPAHSVSLKSELMRAVSLYSGDFLSEFRTEVSVEFDQWCSFEREALRRAHADTLSRLVELCAQEGEIDAAIDYAHRIVALDHLDESAHRELMRLYASVGRRNAALRQFETCRKLLRAEIDVEPEPETVACADKIRTGQFTPVGRVKNNDRESGAATQRSLPLVGRESELAELQSMIYGGQARLLTLVGQGGIGKTRLATEVADSMRNAFPDGTFLLSLEQTESSRRLMTTIVSALGINPDQQADIAEQIFAYLSGRSVLFLLDNVDGLQHRADSFLGKLVEASTGVQVILTARAPLELPWESVFQVQPLCLPDSRGHERLEDSPAFQLFFAVARRASNGFRMSEENREDLLRILAILDGLPLGIELAAPLVRVLSCSEIANELERGLDLLKTESTARPMRHRSIRAVFGPAWAALAEGERQTLCGLTLFCGDVRIQTARSALGVATRDLLRLISSSLVAKVGSDELHVHPLLVRFAREKLEDQPELMDELSRKFVEHYTLNLEQHTKALKGTGQRSALVAIDAELDHIIAAWELALDAGDLQSIGRMLPSMVIHQKIRGRMVDAEQLFRVTRQKLLTLSAGSRTEEEGRLPAGRLILSHVSVFLSYMCHKLGNKESARQFYEEAEAGLEEETDADAALYLGIAAGLGFWDEPSHSRGEHWLKKASDALERCPDEFVRSFVLRVRGDRDRCARKWESAAGYYRESLAVSQTLGERWGEGYAVKCLGEVAFGRGDYREAQRLYEEGLANRTRVGDKGGIAWDTGRLGLIAYAMGDNDRARDNLTRSLELNLELGNFGEASWRAAELADLEADAGNIRAAEALLDQAARHATCVESPTTRGRVMLLRSRLAMKTGHAETAASDARTALGLFASSGNQEWQTEAAYQQALASISMDTPDEARDLARKYTERIAMEENPHAVLRAVVLAAMLTYEDSTDDALRSAFFVLDHPASWHSTKVQAEQIIDKAEASENSTRLNDLRESARGRTARNLVAPFIGNGSDGFGERNSSAADDFFARRS